MRGRMLALHVASVAVASLHIVAATALGHAQELSTRSRSAEILSPAINRGNTALMTITVGDAISGVRVLSPDSDEFAHISLRIPPQPRETILKLRPYVAMIISRDPRPIVAYSVAFETEREGGARDGVMVQVRYPDAIVPGAQRNLLQGLRADAVVPDEARLIAKEVAVGSDIVRHDGDSSSSLGERSNAPWRATETGNGKTP